MKSCTKHTKEKVKRGSAKRCELSGLAANNRKGEFTVEARLVSGHNTDRPMN